MTLFSIHCSNVIVLLGLADKHSAAEEEGRCIEVKIKRKGKRWYICHFLSYANHLGFSSRHTESGQAWSAPAATPHYYELATLR